MSILVKSLTAAVLVCTSAFAAHSASVTLESVTGAWTQTTGGDKVRGVGSSQISWGRPAEKQQSGYSFDAIDTSSTLTPSSLFEIGTFTHHNRPIYGNAITTASLSVSLTVAIGGQNRTIDTSFDFSHLETLNSARTCANGANGSGVNVNGCADRVTVSRNTEKTQEFVIDGVRYSFTVTGFEGMTELWSAEDQDNSYSLFGYFTELGSPDPNLNPTPVPLPAAAWLLGAGVIGLAGLSRRRR